MIVALRTSVTVLLMLLPFMTAVAQDDLLPEEEEVRRYTVEMIIFKYAQDVSTGSEIFPPDEAPQALLPGADQQNEQPVSAAELDADESPVRIRDTELVVLPRDQYSMNDTQRRLDLLEVYDPLMHFGWTQATWPERETLAIELGELARVPTGLDGRLTLYLGRFLHLVVDLTLDAPDSERFSSHFETPASSYGDSRLGATLAGGPDPGEVRYRINEDRILRSGELRYFDHPKFGVLAKVTRVEEDRPDPATSQ